MGGSINDGENVSVALSGEKRANYVHMNMSKSEGMGIGVGEG